MDRRSFTCRTCLRSCDQVSMDNPGGLQLQFETCIPELTLGIVKDYVLCRECIESLLAAYSFKKMCLETEEKIYNYILCSSCENTSVDIDAVVAWSGCKNGGEEFVKGGNDLLEIHKHEPDDDFKCFPDEKPPDVESEQVVKLPECCVVLNRLPQNVIAKYTRNRVRKKPECKPCNLVFKNQASKQRHDRTEHKKKYHCKDCAFVASTKTAFFQHRETHYVRKKRYRCSKCSYFTVDEDSLLHHMKQHVAKYGGINCLMLKCVECKYASHIRYEVEAHYLKVHYLERPFSCNLCKANFALRSHLIDHIIAHSVSNLEVQIEHSYALILND